MIDTVLYDFDGTIMNTTGVILASWKHAFKTLTGEDVDEERLYPTFGEPLEITMKKFFPDIPTDVAVEAYRSFHRDNFGDMITLYPGMKEALIAIKEEGLKTALVTSRLAQTTHQGLDAYGLTPYLDEVVTIEDCTRHKPDPEPVHIALRKLGSKPENTLMLGDTKFDMLCAQNAGVMPVLVGWSTALQEGHLPPEVKPAFILHWAGDLIRIIREENEK